MNKSFVLGFLVAVICLFCAGAASVYNGIAQPVVLHSSASPYYLLREEANNTPTDISLTDSGDFASKPSDAKDIIRDALAPNAIQFIFAGGDAADKSFSWAIYAWRSQNGMAELLAKGTGTLGTQAVVKYPHNGTAATNKYYADTLTITEQGLPKTFQVADAGGNNRTAKLYGDICGYRYVYCVVSNAGGSGVEAEKISVYYSTF